MLPENFAADADWEIWYQDIFDRDAPRQVELAGRGLVDGLFALWLRHLFETVQPDGKQGFSRFNLWWKQQKTSITVSGDQGGQARLREWIFRGGDPESPDRVLLTRLATAHYQLLLRSGTSDVILAAAAKSQSREDFEERLSSL